MSVKESDYGVDDLLQAVVWASDFPNGSSSS